MTGWLIVNSFLDSAKWIDLYRLFFEAAEQHHIRLIQQRTDQLFCRVGDFNKMDLPDFSIFWDKDICLAQRLEAAGVHLFNCAKALELCDNKALTALTLSQADIPMPDTMIAPKTFDGIGYGNADFIAKAFDVLGYPMILKEVYGSYGKQVYLVSTMQEALQTIRQIGSKEFLMQKFIKSSMGRDVRINVVGNQVVASMLRYNPHDFRSNLSNGGKMKPWEPTQAQKDAALNAAAALGLDYAGVDVLFGEEDAPIICEVNSNPHFRSTLDCTGVNLATRILQHILEVIK